MYFYAYCQLIAIIEPAMRLIFTPFFKLMWQTSWYRIRKEQNISLILKMSSSTKQIKQYKMLFHDKTNIKGRTQRFKILREGTDSNYQF
jgi:predicted P-loop ATPase/GTPase